LIGQRDAIRSQLEATSKEVADLKNKKSLYFRAAEVLRKLVEKTAEKDMEKVENFVSLGLHKVVHDQTIDCKINISPTVGASKVYITGAKKTDKGIIEGPFTENFGGGSWNIASFVLRLITILRMDLRKRVFLDESFNNLSEEYQPAMGELIRSLVEKLVFKCLLITHMTRFNEVADRVYRASLVGGDELVLHREK